MKQAISFLLCVALSLVVLTPCFSLIAYADPDPSTPEIGTIEEEYTGISIIAAALKFSGGNAVCGGQVKLRSGYTASVIMMLRKNGVVTETWYYSASSGQALHFSESYGAVSGSTYQVVVKATVYDGSDNVVCRATATTDVKTCP